ncbi:MAG: ATP-binding protein [Saprospiraceae bacterium]
MNIFKGDNSRGTKAIRKAVLVVGGCFLVLAVSLRYQKYQAIVSQSENLTLESLEKVVWGVAQLIDGDKHQQLQETFLERDAITAADQEVLYDQIHLQLERTQQELGFETPLYTYTSSGVEAGFEFIATSSKEPYYRHEMSSAPARQIAAYGEYMSMRPYEDGHGTWLSACAPILNSNGEVVAMVQADRCFDLFIAEAEAQAYAGVWWNLLLIVGLLVMVWRYMSTLITKEEEAKIALRANVAEKTLLLDRLELREIELEQQKAMLVNKNQYLEDFANIASHDLKSPLRGISNFAGLLSRRMGPNAESSATEYIDFIKSNAKRALKLVDGILSYSKLGEEAQNNVPSSLEKVASNALENLYSVIQDRNAKVSVCDSLPEAVFDPVIVTQLFQNLIGNGLKYNQSDVPTVDVTCDVDEQQRYVFAVTDNGIGIPKEYQKSVFEMFKRLHAGGDEYEGSGIGLAFCSRIINSYGGEIWLESEEGMGSTFYFTLPKAFATSPVLATA